MDPNNINAVIKCTHRGDIEQGPHFRINNRIPHQSIDSQLARFQFYSANQDSRFIFGNSESIVELIKPWISFFSFTKEHLQCCL